MPYLIYSKKFLGHRTVSHPESKERLEEIIKFLHANGYKKFEKPAMIGKKELLLAHSELLVKKVEQLSKQAPCNGMRLLDNWFNKNTFEIAKLAAGAAVKAAELCKKDFAFSLARPPGHHAGKDFFGGFCYFNNIAVAVQKTLQKSQKKIMIADFDLHHGNGTQAIFEKNHNVFYFSLHQDPESTYPGTGKESENNEHIMNVPLAAGTSEKEYLKIFSKNFGECLEKFEPELLAVSAGFDILSADKIVGNSLNIFDTKIFGKIGKEIASKKIPCFAVLEGGYALSTLGESAFNFLKAFE